MHSIKPEEKKEKIVCVLRIVCVCIYTISPGELLVDLLTEVPSDVSASPIVNLHRFICV